jgi:hypothetical protein
MIGFNPFQTLSTPFIWGWSNLLNEEPFDGIQDVENSHGNSIKLMWNHHDGVDFWNIYIKPNDDIDLFTETYLLGKFPNLVDSIFVRTEANPSVLLNPENEYYLGVRYEIDGVEDENISVVKIRPFVINPYWINDRHIGTVQ